MPLIEGIGDEVVQFVIVVLAIAVTALAWWSTGARPDRYRTILIMRSRTHPHSTVSIRTRSNATPNTTIQANNRNQVSLPPLEGQNVAHTETEPHSDNSRVTPLQEMDSIVDADMAMMNNNRLHFYRRTNSSNETQNVVESTQNENEHQEESELASNAQIREMDSIVNAMEADVTAECDFFNRSNTMSSLPSTGDNLISNDCKKDETVSSSESLSNGDVTVDQATPSENTTKINHDNKILIKLKYLNETLKEVDGSLDELLKDFKGRHFARELSSECRVRLIFNGHVLVEDSATLRACGLHHQAVVHCLVLPKRVATQQRGLATVNEEPTLTASRELVTEAPPPDRSWDFENILMTLVTMTLTFVWFFRYEYSNMFTASASVALFGLTLFYSIAIFSLYITDSFQIERRPVQPQPANAN